MQINEVQIIASVLRIFLEQLAGIVMTWQFTIKSDCIDYFTFSEDFKRFTKIIKKQ